jgi:ABC-type uncharacterized transport system substrate-binding protein
MWHLGILNTGRLDATEEAWDAFRQGLASLGYHEGHNVLLGFRSAEGEVQRLASLAEELIARQVDIIIAVSAPAIQAAKATTQTIPIVFQLGSDPVRTGLVASFDRPGGNATGLAMMSHEFSGMRVEVLREAAPSLRSIGFLGHPDNVGVELQLQATIAVAASHGIDVTVLAARGIADVERVFESAGLEGVDAIVIASDAMILGYQSEIANLVARHRLPAIAPFRSYAEAGCLIAFGPSILEMYRRAAIYIDKILRGAKPADLPIERPTKYDFVINLHTAKNLRLTIAPSLMLRADEIIEWPPPAIRAHASRSTAKRRRHDPDPEETPQQ